MAGAGIGARQCSIGRDGLADAALGNGIKTPVGKNTQGKGHQSSHGQSSLAKASGEFMGLEKLFGQRFLELEEQAARVRLLPDGNIAWVDSEDWQAWATSALNLVRHVFGEDSPHHRNLQRIYDSHEGFESSLRQAKGVLAAAKSDLEAGLTVSLERQVSGSLLGDFLGLAKAALQENQKDVAAVLACAALEDALKRFATRHGLQVDDKSMPEVVAALRSQGLVGGAQKSLLGVMPKIRDHAMHAQWEKLTAQDVSSVIGFVEQFLLEHF